MTEKLSNMDKSDFLWYNADMNDIRYAGYAEYSDALKSSRYFTVVLPPADGKLFLENGTAEFRGGAALVLPPFVGHTLSPYGKALTVHIEQAVLPFKEVLVIPADKAEGIVYASKQAAEFMLSPLPKKELVLSALGELIASYTVVLTAAREFSPVVELILNDISKNISDSSYSLENFLKKLPFNYDYARKLFKKEVGNTPHGELLKQRMELAATLLSGGQTNRYSGYSVSQVAEACGYAEPLYFSRVFKKYYGTAPGYYAKKHPSPTP